jgi:hypothetical protein
MGCLRYWMGRRHGEKARNGEQLTCVDGLQHRISVLLCGCGLHSVA